MTKLVIKTAALKPVVKARIKPVSCKKLCRRRPSDPKCKRNLSRRKIRLWHMASSRTKRFRIRYLLKLRSTSSMVKILILALSRLKRPCPPQDSSESTSTRILELCVKSKFYDVTIRIARCSSESGTTSLIIYAFIPVSDPSCARSPAATKALPRRLTWPSTWRCIWGELNTSAKFVTVALRENIFWR